MPAPTDSLITTFGGSFETCNDNADYNRDKKALKWFHVAMLKKFGCTVPQLMGSGFGPQLGGTFCTDGAKYNTTVGGNGSK